MVGLLQIDGQKSDGGRYALSVVRYDHTIAEFWRSEKKQTGTAPPRFNVESSRSYVALANSGNNTKNFLFIISFTIKSKYSFRSLYHALLSIHPFTGKERLRTGEGERHIPAEAAASGVGHHIPAAASWAAVASGVGRHHIPAAASWAAVA